MPQTLTDELTFVSFPIEKWDTTEDGDLVVYGKATDGSVDSDLQIVDPMWAKTAVPEWHETGGNVRQSHDPTKAVGTSLGVDLTDDGVFVKSLVVDSNAKNLVKKGVLRAYSVGIARPVVERDISGKARGGIIKGGQLAEISLVDRPANKNCAFTLVKSDASGNLVRVAEMHGDPGLALEKSVTAPSPADIAARVARRRDAGQIGHLYSDPVAQRLADALAESSLAEAVAKSEDMRYAAPVLDAEVAKRVTASGRVVDSSGQDRSDVASGDFAGPGKTFPIETWGDVSDAASLAHHAKNPGAVRSRIAAIARRKWPGKKLPPSLEGDHTGKVFDVDDVEIDTGSVSKALADGNLAEEMAVKYLGYAPESVKDSRSSQETADEYEDNDLDDDEAPQTAGKAAKPFGGNQAKPFGKKPKDGKKMPPGGDDDDDDNDSGKGGRAAEIMKQIEQLQAELAKCTPTVGVQGVPQASPVPAHRGGGSMDCGPDVIHPDQPWGKAVKRTTDAPYSAQRAHDATCPAYDPVAVKAAYPALAHPGVACDPGELKEAALSAVASGDLDGGERLLAAAKAAEMLSKADPLVIADAMAGLRKAFTDMYPSVRLSPGEIMPGQFHRPYISAGHANAPAPSGDTSPGTVPSYHPMANDFRRGPLTAGHESPSPGNKGDSNPFPAGTPAGQVYDHAADAQQAAAQLRTIHNHFAARWNGVCPMGADAGPATGIGKGKKKKSKKPPAEWAPMDPIPSMPATPSSVKVNESGFTATYVPSSDYVAQTGDISVLLARVERQLRKLGKAREEQDSQIAELTKGYESRLQHQQAEIDTLRRSVDILGSQPDTADAPNRSVVAKAASAVIPAERRSLVDEAGEQHRAGYLSWLQSLENSGDPQLREGAKAQIRKMLST